MIYSAIALVNRCAGYNLAQLPVDVRIGKILIMGALLNCISPTLSIAACLSHKSPFLKYEKSTVAPFLSKEGRYISSQQQSDHLVLAAAIEGWIRASSSNKSLAFSYAKKHDLSIQNIEIIMEMRHQFALMLADGGLLEKTNNTAGRTWYDSDTCIHNANKDSSSVVKAVIVASLYPNVAIMGDASPGSRPTWHDGLGPVALHPSSALVENTEAAFHRPFLVYNEKVRTSKVFLRDCTVASPLSLYLFGGAINIDHRAGLAIVDGWIRMKVPARCAAILLAVRQYIQGTMMTLYRKRSNVDDPVMPIIIKLLEQEENLRAVLCA